MRCRAILAALLLAACGEDPLPEARRVFNGDPEEGRRLIAEAGCGTCHVIPGVAGARGNVGPPLNGFAKRAIIAGQIPNRGDDLVRWILDPPGIEPGTAMPSSGLTEVEARHVAAYLYTLRRLPGSLW